LEYGQEKKVEDLVQFGCPGDWGFGS
jgi:hypothetical protein